MSKRRQDKLDDSTNKNPLVGRTKAQKELVKALNVSDTIITYGPAGTGKTYLYSRHAARKLKDRFIDKIVLTRPNVSASNRLGFLPGTFEEKYEPWVTPILDAMIEEVDKGTIDIWTKNGNIDLVPFELMRGRTFKNCIVILDEAQNTNEHEMIMFLTRIGENSQILIGGDLDQSDIKEPNGLDMIVDMVYTQELPVTIIEFDDDDIVRDPRVKMWLNAWETYKYD